MMEVRIYTHGFVEPDFTRDESTVIAYRVEEKLKSEGLPLGSVSGKCCTLKLKKEPSFTPEALKGALVTVSNGGNPLGHWFVSGTETEENSPYVTLTGGDALMSGFEASFTDAPSAYPRTLKNLVSTLCAAGGSLPVTQNFPNGDSVFRVMPRWEDNLTLRRALSHCAFLAGGFVRMNGEGNAELVPCTGGNEIALTEEDCLSCSEGPGAPFAFNAIEYRFAGETAYTRFALNASLADTPQNALRAGGNPLVTATMLNNTVRALAGADYTAGRVVFRSETLPQAGDVICLTTAGNDSRRMLITGLTTTYAGGAFTCEANCELPLYGAAGGGFSTALSAFNADGTLNFEAIGEVNEKVAAIDKATIGSLTAGEITALGLVSKVIEAVELRARSIDAQSARTDELTAMAAEIMHATVRKLAAGTVTTDALLTACAELIAAKVGSLTAQDISSDRLASALAAFQVLTAGSAEFDRATVRHLLGSALNIDYGVGDTVTIRNLSADYASLVNASVGTLTVKAADGNYYALNVSPEGNVSAVPAVVDESEESSGMTRGGRTLIETELTAEQLNASGLHAVRALIGKLDASRIDAGTLFAGEAFLDRLNTADIRSNGYLRTELNALLERTDENGDVLTELLRYMVFSEEGLRQRKPGSAYSTLTDEKGYHIDRDGSVEHVGSFTAGGLTAAGVKIGKIRARRTYSGGWVWQYETEEV